MSAIEIRTASGRSISLSTPAAFALLRMIRVGLLPVHEGTDHELRRKLIELADELEHALTPPS